MKKIITLLTITILSVFIANNITKVNALEEDYNLKISIYDMDSNELIEVEEYVSNIFNIYELPRSYTIVDNYITKSIQLKNQYYNVEFRALKDISLTGANTNQTIFSSHRLYQDDVFTYTYDIESDEYISKINNDVIETSKRYYFTDFYDLYMFDTNLTNINLSTYLYGDKTDYSYALTVTDKSFNWDEHLPYQIWIPEGFKLRSTYSDQSLIGKIEFIPKMISSKKVYEVMVDGVKLGNRNQGDSRVTYTFDHVDRYTLKINGQLSTYNRTINGIKENTRIFDLEQFDDIENSMHDYQKSEYYYDINLTNKVGDNDLINKNINIYQKIVNDEENDTFTLMFNSNGGSAIDNMSWERSDYDYYPGIGHTLSDFGVTELPKPIKQGYHFLRWIIVGEEDYKYNILDKPLTGKNDMTLIAVYSKYGEKIEVNLQGYGIIETKVGEKLSKDLLPDNITDLNKVNKRFLGFVYNGQTEYVDIYNQIFYEDTTLYSKWEEPKGSNVTFNVNGGIYIETILVKRILNTVTFKNNLPEARRNNYAFVGWYIDEELTIPVPEKINISNEDGVFYYDVTLYAKWAYNASKVYFHTNVPNLEISPRIIEKGERLNLVNHPTRNGYIFLGWFIDEEFTLAYKGEQIFDDIVNLYAAWELDEGYEEPPVDNTEQYIIYAIYGVIGMISIGIIGAVFFPKKNRRR